MYRFETKDSAGDWVLIEEQDCGPALQEVFTAMNLRFDTLRVLDADTKELIPLVGMKITFNVGSDMYSGIILRCSHIRGGLLVFKNATGENLRAHLDAKARFKISGTTTWITLGEAKDYSDPSF